MGCAGQRALCRRQPGIAQESKAGGSQGRAQSADLALGRVGVVLALLLLAGQLRLQLLCRSPQPMRDKPSPTAQKLAILPQGHRQPGQGIVCNHKPCLTACMQACAPSTCHPCMPMCTVARLGRRGAHQWCSAGPPRATARAARCHPRPARCRLHWQAAPVPDQAAPAAAAAAAARRAARAAPAAPRGTPAPVCEQAVKHGRKPHSFLAAFWDQSVDNSGFCHMWSY